MNRNGEKKRLTLDDVLQKLQAGEGIEAVSNTDKVQGGAAVYGNCHLAAASTLAK